MSDDESERIFDKLEKIEDRLTNVDITLVKQEGNLAEHMRRSLANERAVEILEEEFKRELKPITAHVGMVNGTLKALGIISIVLGIITGLMKIYSMMN
jgi:hypothetical protein